MYHLKIAPPGHTLDKHAMRQEFMNALFASESGLGPRVVWVDIERQALLTDFKMTESPELRRAGLGSMVVQANLEQMRRLHLSTAPHIPLATVSAADATQDLWQYAHTSWLSRAVPRPGTSAPFETDSIERYAVQLIARLGGYGYREYLCHGDYNASNSIWSGGRVWIIDWARLRPCDALGELAYYGFHIGSGIDEAEALLYLYDRDAARDVATLDRLRLHIALFHLNRYALRVQGQSWHNPDPDVRARELQVLADIVRHDAATLGLVPPTPDR